MLKKIRWRGLLIHTFFICCLFIQLVSCSPIANNGQENLINTYPDESIGDKLGYKIYIFKLANIKNSHDLSANDYEITESDIVQYNWAKQTIVLSNGLMERYKADETFLSDGSLFVVTLNGEKIIQGHILHASSPRQILSPIMYVLEHRMYPEYPEGVHDLTIALRPQHVWGKVVDSSLFSVDDPVLAEQVRQHFEETGKLIE